jgi:hypothetical protein
MSLDQRTEKDRIYYDILRKHGELTNTQLRNLASKSSIFENLSEEAMDKDVDRFIARNERMALLTRKNGKLQFAINSKSQIRASSYPTSGFLMSRNGIVCRHCANKVDLTKLHISPKGYWKRMMTRKDAEPFSVTCPYCKKKDTYDMIRDVKPILPETSE